MVLPRFDYHSPTSLQEAVEWLSKYKKDGVRILAGGTDLLVNMRSKIIPDGHRPRCQQHRVGPWQARHAPTMEVKWLLALSRIRELQFIREEGNLVRIGCMTTHSDIEKSLLIRERLSGLWDGASQLGSPLCRNRGTYGGNLCNARPASDTSIPTMALNGRLVLASVRGERTVDHRDFVTGPGQTVIEPDEILKEVVFELPESTKGESGRYTSGYIKLGNRKSLEIAVVGAAAAVKFSAFNGNIGKVENASIVLASVAPTPLLVKEASNLLIGRELTTERISEAARTASRAAKPITDHRGSAHYRTMMIEVLVKRVLNRCIERALSGSTREVDE